MLRAKGRMARPAVHQLTLAQCRKECCASSQVAIEELMRAELMHQANGDMFAPLQGGATRTQFLALLFRPERHRDSIKAV